MTTLTRLTTLRMATILLMACAPFALSACGGSPDDVAMSRSVEEVEATDAMEDAADLESDEEDYEPSDAGGGISASGRFGLSTGVDGIVLTSNGLEFGF